MQQKCFLQTFKIYKTGKNNCNICVQIFGKLPKLFVNIAVTA